MNNGVSNSLILGLTLARNSIDNPLYTRSGSDISLNLGITPPASLFGKKDWKKLSQENTVESKKSTVEQKESAKKILGDSVT